MKYSTANRVCKNLSRQYGVVSPPEIIPLKYSRKGKRVILGYYDNANNRIEINRYAMELWRSPEIHEIIKHELIHALSYQEFGCGGHGRKFKELCERAGLCEDTARAVKGES